MGERRKTKTRHKERKRERREESDRAVDRDKLGSVD